MSTAHDAESLLLAISRLEREAAARLGPCVTIALGPRMTAALAQAQGASVHKGEQSKSIVQ